MSDKRLNLVCLITIAALAAGVFLPWLGSMTLFDIDETLFANAAREMGQIGDYVVPYFNGEAFYDKPPLMYWVMIAGYRVFGVNEMGARIGSALAGIGSCLLIFVLGKAMFGRAAALIAAVVAATTLMVLVECRIATADSVLMLTTMLMFLGFWRVCNGRRRLASWLMLYGGLAAGSLTKGPVSFAVLAVSAAIYAMLRREYPTGSRIGARLKLWWHEMRCVARELHLLIGGAAAMAVVLAWLVPALVATDGGFITDGFYKHVVARAFSARAMQGHGGIPVIHYLAILPIAFFPWFAVLPESIRRFWGSSGDRGRRAFLVAWAIAPFLLFSFLRTKLPHYTMPAYPALAIICGWALASPVERNEGFWKHWLGKAGIITSTVVGVGLAVGLAVFPTVVRWPEIRVAMLPVAVSLLVLTVAVWPAFVPAGRLRWQPVAGIAALTVITILLFVGMAAPAFNGNKMYKSLAREVGTLLRPGDTLAHVGRLEPSLVFYLQRELRPAITSEELAGLARLSPRCICIAEKSKSEIVEEAGGTMLKEGRYFSTRKMKWRTMTVWEVQNPER